jgi:hypothetical protein
VILDPDPSHPSSFDGLVFGGSIALVRLLLTPPPRAHPSVSRTPAAEQARGDSRPLPTCRAAAVVAAAAAAGGGTALPSLPRRPARPATHVVLLLLGGAAWLPQPPAALIRPAGRASASLRSPLRSSLCSLQRASLCSSLCSSLRSSRCSSLSLSRSLYCSSSRTSRCRSLSLNASTAVRAATRPPRCGRRQLAEERERRPRAQRTSRLQRHPRANLENDVVDANTVGNEVLLDLHGQESRGSCSERFVSRAAASTRAPSAPMLLL